MASFESGRRSLLQHSQFGRNSSIKTTPSEIHRMLKLGQIASNYFLTNKAQKIEWRSFTPPLDFLVDIAVFK
jgi:hypothetical protein